MNRALLPLIAFVVLVVFLGIGLTKDPRKLPSTFIGKTAPAFSLPQLYDLDKRFSPKDMLGKVWVLNVWASWCVSCRAEHHVLNNMIKNNKVNLIGLNYKDAVTDARDWLGRYGNPYQLSASDVEGLIGIEWGVYGVPETFVMDKKGIVRLKHTGPVTDKDVADEIIPMIKKLEKE
ncbi:MAG: DsbE family thiol:disulfide interchange protein [Gammaproteobacteria bacterium]|nr:DsbE family thiol:disulfide interchange protein [Gammaproteobacteria bacterium]MDH5659366.1 DsbE family thiol:disulfide interchange protein [Gammaproteobacteria bacterium]